MRVIVSPINATLLDPPPEVAAAIHKALTTNTANHSRTGPMRLTPITFVEEGPGGIAFPAGLLRMPAVLKALGSAGPYETLETHPAPAPIGKPSELRWWSPERPPRPYQAEAADALVAARRGVVVLPTATGKTTTGALALAAIPGRLAWFVRKRGLVTQPAREFEAAGFPRPIFTAMGGKFPDPDDLPDDAVVFGTVQTAIENENARRYLATATGVFADECHRLPALQFLTLYSLARMAVYRGGFTATLPNDRGRLLALYGATGPRVGPSVTAKSARIRYGIAKKVVAITVEYGGPGFRKNVNPTWAKNALYRNALRNEGVIATAEAVARAGWRPIVFCEWLERQAAPIAEALAARGLRVSLLTGAVPVPERESASTDLAEGRIDVIVATDVLGEGIDLHPACNCAVIVGVTASGLEQRVGRVRRGTADQTALVIDFADVSNRQQTKDDLARGVDPETSTQEINALARANVLRKMSEWIVEGVPLARISAAVVEARRGGIPSATGTGAGA